MPPTNGSDEEQSAEAKPSTSTSNPSATGSSTSSILKERRFKLSRACDRCRRRRIKCDEGHPCQSCLTSNSSCTFEEPGKRTHPHKSNLSALREVKRHPALCLWSALAFSRAADELSASAFAKCTQGSGGLGWPKHSLLQDGWGAVIVFGRTHGES
ncbi:uncharacterized protein B0H18DRAFT_634960 [Fomitopsis serialis]|uniref:uncharacterized protein n=1 Tax=Fomitopsis serialis TaxID=139415 RepID=UPI00200759D5|nr:uncharacterized protein B0H18DRAFT_634960 [Neoantrodia serialis]KAH9905552.1 hypothetical protein B0H18DRAFT_634960 [Neoantrodia serialis]